MCNFRFLRHSPLQTYYALVLSHLLHGQYRRVPVQAQTTGSSPSIVMGASILPDFQILSAKGGEQRFLTKCVVRGAYNGPTISLRAWSLIACTWNCHFGDDIVENVLSFHSLMANIFSSPLTVAFASSPAFNGAVLNLLSPSSRPELLFFAFALIADASSVHHSLGNKNVVIYLVIHRCGLFIQELEIPSMFYPRFSPKLMSFQSFHSQPLVFTLVYRQFHGRSG